jgi:hypothetical protein
MLNNDRFSHWCIGAVLGWALVFALWGLPIFHFWLRVPIPTILTFTGLACVIQLILTPWLFSARSTRQNPGGDRVKRGLTIAVWFTMLAMLFDYFLFRGSSPDPVVRMVFLATPVGMAAAWVVILLVNTRKKTAKEGKA